MTEEELGTVLGVSEAKARRLLEGNEDFDGSHYNSLFRVLGDVSFLVFLLPDEKDSRLDNLQADGRDLFPTDGGVERRAQALARFLHQGDEELRGSSQLSVEEREAIRDRVLPTALLYFLEVKKAFSQALFSQAQTARKGHWLSRIHWPLIGAVLGGAAAIAGIISAAVIVWQAF